MLIKIKVFPDSKKEKIVKLGEDRFEIRVREKAKEGRANQRAIELLAEFLGISPDKIKIVKGAKKQNKILKIFA